MVLCCPLGLNHHRANPLILVFWSRKRKSVFPEGCVFDQNEMNHSPDGGWGVGVGWVGVPVCMCVILLSDYFEELKTSLGVASCFPKCSEWVFGGAYFFSVHREPPHMFSH